MPGGRPLGAASPNRREARSILKERFPDWHPFVQLAQTAQGIDSKGNPDAKSTYEMRFQAAKEVNAYLMPKLKAVEHSGEVRTSVVLFKSDAEL